MVEDPLYMGFDLSTQQLKGTHNRLTLSLHHTDAFTPAIVVKTSLKLIHEAKVDFDADLSHYGIQKGVLTNLDKGEIFSPVAMWLEAIDLVMSRLKEQGVNFAKVKGISGAGMQHGTVFWSKNADTLMGSLDPGKGLLEQLNPADKKEAGGVFSHPFSPNWQDASTQKQCEEFDKALGSPKKLAEVTGSSAHHVSSPSCCSIQMENLSTNEMELFSDSAVPKLCASANRILQHTPPPLASPSFPPS